MYDFEKNSCVMVFGKNETDPGADSNGSGKSSLLEGITLAFTGKTSRDVGRDEFIMDEEDECYVEMDLENKISETKNLKIIRTIHRKRSAKVEIWENGELNSQITSVNEANDRIYEIIGITREDLLNFFIIGQDNNYSFLSSGDANQKKIISRITNIDLVLERIEILKLERKSQVEVVEEQKREIQKYENFIELTQNDIEEEKEEGANKIQEEIDAILEENVSAEEDIEEYEEKSLKKEEEKSGYEKKIEEIRNTIKDTSKLEKKIYDNDEKIRKLKKQISQNKHFIDEMNRILDGNTVCPKCKYEWNEGEDLDLTEIPAAIGDSQKNISSLELQIKDFEKKNVSLNKDLESNDKRKKFLRTLKDDLEDVKSELKRFERKIKNNKETIKENKKTIKELKDSIKNNSKIKELEEKVKSYEEILKRHLTELESKQEDLDNIDYWLHHFSKKGFLTFLANQSVKTIEGITNSYLKNFNTDLRVKIDGFTTLKSGDVSEKINIQILRNGINVGSYNRYSGGEKGRINIANIVGLQKLINMSAKDGGLNFLGLDEVFEGLDVSGQRDVLKTLETTGITTMVVSHRSEAIGAKNEIFIVKRNGISQIQNEEKN